ncbi:MAG: 4-hydroxy-tetrahydrodipicolinate synthase [Ponticaulis sp.]|nr:4-hydroxy-tetrahydrodipicolinate synthase [Ponticaulis sp.]|tara:strand:+ start:1299 stop:2174 length:876 start_codon:yes stop_codon:yes gene_type:complete
MFKGSIPALVTPFRNDEVDYETYKKLVDRQIEAGSGALVPCGTTGESATLSHKEHYAIIEHCVESVAGRVPIIAGCGSNSTAEAIGLVSHAKRVGADAALTVCPYYNRPDQDGLYAHFSAIADAVEMPLILYNVPSRTSSDIAPETVARLSQHPNIVGIKDATGDLARVTRHLNECAEGFVLLSGDDPSAIGFTAMGGQGCISVTANVVPDLMADLHTACLSGDFETARAIEARVYPLHKALFRSPSPGPAKYALSVLGLCEPTIRLPLLSPKPEIREEIEAAMRQADILN